MRKLIYLFWVVAFALPATAQSDSWYVQTGVFEQKVGLDYFNKIGHTVHYSKDAFGFHRYFIGTFNDEASAQNAKQKADQLGFYGVVVSRDELDNTCRCNYIPTPQSILGSLKNIFFDFDRSNLRSESQRQLKELTKVLQDFPNYYVTLRAHTDAKGSLTYNRALSLRRAASARKYVLARGIAANRIKIETFGEETPIAKNELNDGRDTEQGRQLNRRVEILIMDLDGNIVNSLVDEIEVPDELEG